MSAPSGIAQQLLFGSAEPAPPSEPIRLRSYQVEGDAAVQAVRADDPRARVLAVAPTGAGKTTLFGHWVLAEVARGGRCLVIAHRTELIAQARARLIAQGLPAGDVGVVMGDGRLVVDGRVMQCARPLAPVQVCSIDTLRRRQLPRGVTLVVIDECFPAGTLVDGRPIESIATGDEVRSFNHATGRVEMRRVTHTFRSRPQGALVTVRLADGSRITCTAGHPIYTRGGYVHAAALTPGVEVFRHVEDQPEGLRGLRHDVRAAVVEQHDDAALLAPVQAGATGGAAARGGDLVRAVPVCRGAEGADAVPVAPRGAGVLLAGVPERRGGAAVGAGARGDEPADGERADAGAQPDAAARGAGEDGLDAPQDRAPAEGARGEREACARAAADDRGGPRVADGGRGPDAHGAGERLADALQARRGVAGEDGRDRGGRAEPRHGGAADAGRAEGCVPAWVRVDGVEVHERAGDGGPGVVCPDGHVYNLEVDGNHNYFVGGVLVHNCHRSLSKSYRDVVAAYPDAFVVGVTATPYRGDGRGLGDVYQRLVVVTSPRALMAEGYLSEPRVFSHPHRADVSKVKTIAGDYDQEKLAEECDKAELLGSIVEHWQKHLAGVRTVAFAVNVKHSRHIAQMFRDAGVPAEHLDGETPSDVRAAILRRLDRGETLVGVNCGILCEGWDQPSVKGCILARPTKSRALYVQQAGRVLRPWQSATPILLDHAGCVLEHDLPHADVELTLDGRKRKAKSSIAVKDCRQCFGMIPSNAKVCPYCGCVFGTADSAEGRELVERDGQLVEVRPEVLAEEERQRARKRLAGVTWALACEQSAAGRGDREENARELNGWLRRRYGKREYMTTAALREAHAEVEKMLDEEVARREMLAPVAARSARRFEAPAVEEVAAW